MKVEAKIGREGALLEWMEKECTVKCNIKCELRHKRKKAKKIERNLCVGGCGLSFSLSLINAPISIHPCMCHLMIHHPSIHAYIHTFLF